MVTDLRQLQRVANFFGLGRKPAKVDKPVKVGLLGASQVRSSDAEHLLMWQSGAGFDWRARNQFNGTTARSAQLRSYMPLASCTWQIGRA